jgi:hypothetical protein
VRADQDEYARATAIVAHTTISMSITHRFPELTPEERAQMFVDIIDRLARLRGWSVRREVCARDDE